MLTTLKSAKVTSIKQSFEQLSFEYDYELKALWACMAPKELPNFNLDILHEMRAFDEEFERNNCHVLHEGELSRVDYYVAKSMTEGTFNLGGDLTLFLRLIQTRDRQGLINYAHLCIDNIYSRSANYNHQQLTTIGLIQGNALGGGFELALSNDVIIAERQSNFGFPEIMFNLFPGMGALSFLARRIGLREAEKLVSTPKMYTAEEMHDLGVVDVLTEKGQGELAVYDYIRANERQCNGFKAIRAACRNIHPILKSELLNITDIWVDAALRITEKDLKMMDRIIHAQKKLAPHVDASVSKAPDRELVLAKS